MEKQGMKDHILGIDATNIRAGGGVTHLKEMLRSCNPHAYGFKKVVVWSNQGTLAALDDAEWLIKETHPYLEKSFIWAFTFQKFILGKRARQTGCSIIFSPGGSFLSSFRPFVTMSRNMLPFEMKEVFRYEKWTNRIRFIILRFVQASTFNKASGLIFLTHYAKNIISEVLKLDDRKTTIIPHGIHQKNALAPKPQQPTETYSKESPFNLLYVSVVNPYKHQWNVAEAVCKLWEEGYPLLLTLVGPKSDEAFYKLDKVLSSNPSSQQCVRYLGAVKHANIYDCYSKTDAFVFASSCENLPNILIEAMSAGLPIASSNLGPMPEVMGDAGVYFNPESVEEICTAIKKLYHNPELRAEAAQKAYLKTLTYTWKNCSDDTFSFLSKILQNHAQ